MSLVPHIGAIASGGGGGGGGDADAAAYLTAVGITDPDDMDAYEAWFVSMKAAGIYTKMQAVYLFPGPDAAANKWNAVDPRDLDAAFRLTYTGGITHTNGLLPNGTTGWANTRFNPLTSATLNNHGLSICSNTNNTPPGSDSCDIGMYDGAGTNVTSLAIRGGAGKATLTGRQFSTNITAANASAIGFFTSTRNGASNTEIYKDGVSQAAGSGAGAVPGGAATIAIGGRNDNGTINPSSWTNQNYIFAAIHQGLSDAEVLDLYNIYQTLKTYLGR